MLIRVFNFSVKFCSNANQKIETHVSITCVMTHSKILNSCSAELFSWRFSLFYYVNSVLLLIHSRFERRLNTKWKRNNQCGKMYQSKGLNILNHMKILFFPSDKSEKKHYSNQTKTAEMFAARVKTIKQKRYQEWKSNKYKNVIKNARAAYTMSKRLFMSKRTHNKNTKTHFVVSGHLHEIILILCVYFWAMLMVVQWHFNLHFE